MPIAIFPFEHLVDVLNVLYLEGFFVSQHDMSALLYSHCLSMTLISPFNSYNLRFRIWVSACIFALEPVKLQNYAPYY
jgi:hypothetical protein